jgi:hypothetical protein
VRGSVSSGWSLDAPEGSGTTGKEGPSLGCLREPREVSIRSAGFRLVPKLGHASLQVGQAGQGNGPGGAYTGSRSWCRGSRLPPAVFPNRRLQVAPTDRRSPSHRSLR